MKEDQDARCYNDIIDLPHHVSANRPQMAMIDRAAQFAPFKALAGHDDAIIETERLTQGRPELSEDIRIELDRKYRILTEHITAGPEVTIKYFVPDPNKQGGAYRTASGRVKKADTFMRCIVLWDERAIPMDEIVELESDLF